MKLKQEALKEKLSEIKEKGLDAAESLGKLAKEKGEQLVDLAYEAKDKAEIVVEEAKETGKKIKENIDQMREETDRKLLKPIFLEDIEENTFDYPRMINICFPDEKHKNNIVCLDSIGHKSTPNDVELLNIYKDNLDKFKVVLEPTVVEGIYYANPSLPGTYVEIEKYFTYIQKEKATELLNIARDLGAKYVKIEISVKEISGSSESGKVQAKVGKNKVEASAEKKQKETRTVDVFADEELGGHDDPIRPRLVYFKNDKTILDIIEQRFNQKNVLKKHTFKIDSSSSSSMKMKEAAKIDGALNSMKCGLSESMAIGAEKAASTYFSYTIEF